MSTKIIFGPPGTGKTSYLLNRLEEELDSGVEPRSIAFVSFTTAAVKEAMARARRRFGITERDVPHFKTLHALAFNALSLGRAAVLSDYAEFARDVGLRLRKRNLHDIGFESAGADDLLLRAHQLSSALMLPFEEVARRYRLRVSPERYALFVRKLDDYKRERRVVEYHDMLQQFIDANLSVNVDVAFIDEAQDLTPQQWRMVSAAFRGASRMYVAGDDDQAIYHWAGADVERILTLPGERIVLGESHRLPQRIKHFADGISTRISRRQPKHWRGTAAPGELSVGSALSALEICEGSWMMLARSTYALAPYCAYLEARGIPYRINGADALRAQEVESYRAMCALRAGEGVRGDVAKRMLQRGAWTGLRTTFRTSAMITREDLDERALLDEAALLNNVPASRLRFMRRVAARGEWDVRVDVSTIHQAKGAEADHVVVAPDMSRATHDALSSPSYADDEHRVWYVAVSRARRSLRILKKSAEFCYKLA